MADKLKGIWVFDKVLYDDNLGGIITRFSVDFVSNGQSFKSIAFTMLNGYQNREYTNQINYVNNTDGAIGDGVYAYRAGGWNTAYKTIEITSYYDEVENADNLLKMLQARATFTPWGEDYEIPLATAKGVLLRTAGKSCDRDIVVKPELEELKVTENGEYVSTKAGYSKVSVNVASGGETIPEISEPLTLSASIEGAEEGELVVAYNLSEKVALPTGTNKPLGILTDENFIPSNIKKDVYIFGLKGEYEGEGGGGDGEFTADKYFEGGYAEVNLPNATKIKQYSFYNDTIIETIKAPEATSIGDRAFYSCNALKSVLADKVTELGEYSFYGCSSLPSLNVPLVTQIKGSAFYGCSSLEEITAPLVKKIGSSAFSSCSNLKTVYFPDVTTLGSSAFTMCSFTEAIFPKCTDLGSGYTFQNNTALKKVVVKHASYLYYSTFQGCTSLEVFDCGNIRSVYSNAFKDCSSLKAFIIRNLSSVPSLNSINDFAGSGIANGSGYIYVPSAWVNNLASATNWSAFATQIRVLEDYTVDGTVNGELDITKI